VPQPLAVALAGVLAIAGAAGPRVVLRMTDPRVTESSGLVASGRHPGVLWTLNDSDNAPLLFAVGPDGRTRAALRLRVDSRDWEGLAPGRDQAGRPALYVGDIGDNASARTLGVLVHVVAEPARLRDATVRPVSYRLRYPDRPQNAEALLVDPSANRLYVATKEALGGRLYQAPARLRTDRPNVMTRLGRVPALVTDGAFGPGGRLVLRSYGRAYVYDRVGAAPRVLALPDQPQGESLAVVEGGRAVLVGSEGAGSEVWRVPLPASTAPPASSSRPPRPQSPDPGSAPALALVLSAAVLVGGLAARRVARRRRGRG
jgi:hypothetical protein